MMHRAIQSAGLLFAIVGFALILAAFSKAGKAKLLEHTSKVSAQ